MPPTPIDFSGIQPFKLVRDNWATLKPYHDNFLTTISFATVTAAFIGTLSMIIKHGFKMPRVHPAMEVEELEPSFTHPNEYVNVEDLAAAKLFDFEQRERARMAEAEKAWKELTEERRKEIEGEEITISNETEDREDANEIAAEERFQKDAEAGVENAMDILDDEGAFDALP
jgi:hypothetical protein